MSLIEINPDLRRASAALERIAFALEQIVLHEYGVVPVPVKRMWPAASADEHDVGYATNEGTLRQEVEELLRPGDVHEREGDTVAEEVGDIVLPENRRA